MDDMPPTSSTVRPADVRQRTFWSILVNTAIAGLTTSYLWFALTFWIYLQTRNVIATGVVGGAYMLLLSVTSISFGTLVDRHRKLDVMRMAGLVTLAMFGLASTLYLVLPTERLTTLTGPWFWVLALIILIGAVVENMRNIALSTTVTILVEPDRRANANGLVGMVQGLAFMVTSVLSGLSIGRLGMGWTLLIALVLTALALVHLVTIRLPEEQAPVPSDAQGHFDLAGSWRAVMAVSGLAFLILYSCFNNLIGGVYMALMDPYGLELFSVEMWGILFAVASTGFLVGGAVVGRFGLGRNPLRTLLLCVVVMGVIGAGFAVREWGWLFLLGIWLYMCLIPPVEAAEHTVIQRVVPLERQGRVFGFATAVEAAATPITAFLVAPLAELWIIPWARSASGSVALEPWLGTGEARGIALVFLVAGLVTVVAALAALWGPIYPRISREYAEHAADDRGAEPAGRPA